MHLFDFFRCFLSACVELRAVNFYSSETTVRTLSLPILCVAAVFFSTCDESLPPRDEPREALQPLLTGSSGVVVFLGDTSLSAPGSLIVQVKNIHDEVIQGEERLLANLEIWMTDMPEVRGTVQADKRSLVNRRILSGTVLTIEPDVAALLFVGWNHRTADGRRFWSFVQMHAETTNRGEPYMASDSVRLTAAGTVQAFKIRPAQKLPQNQFTVVYHVF